MNIALIALATDRMPLAPPLVLAYVAAVLEQRRHIVRMYDFALSQAASAIKPAQLLQTFRPQVVMIAGESQEQLAATLAELSTQHACIVPMCVGRDNDSPPQVCADVLDMIEQLQIARNEKSVISRRREIGGVSLRLGGLPFPARHLLPLERYELKACGGELQTTLLIGQRTACQPDVYELREPGQIINELRAVAREHGIRHYRFSGAPLTTSVPWLRELAQGLIQSRLEVEWEGAVQPHLLDAELLALLRRAGCESLRFDFDAPEVLESVAARASLKHVVAQARAYGIYARAELALEHPYDAIARLVDVAATFGLDDVLFQAPIVPAPQQHEAANLEELARKLYRAGRSKQHFIDRFGPRLGTLVWNVRHSRLVRQLRGVYEGAAQLEDHEDMIGAA